MNKQRALNTCMFFSAVMAFALAASSGNAGGPRTAYLEFDDYNSWVGLAADSPGENASGWEEVDLGVSSRRNAKPSINSLTNEPIAEPEGEIFKSAKHNLQIQQSLSSDALQSESFEQNTTAAVKVLLGCAFNILGYRSSEKAYSIAESFGPRLGRSFYTGYRYTSKAAAWCGKSAVSAVSWGWNRVTSNITSWWG